MLVMTNLSPEALDACLATIRYAGYIVGVIPQAAVDAAVAEKAIRLHRGDYFVLTAKGRKAVEVML